ncbi:MAG: serine/threonine protein kinase [Deltaproteobacteria bacterium]|nr:serine/threonine protein kinase [Deltaproteobacteria bacterium]
MRAHGFDLDGLLELPAIRDAAARRASFRQGLANLARAAAEWGPSPLEGIAPAVLARSVGVAIESGFFDDLDWLSPAAVGAALYEIGAALPNGPEQRDIGRRVLSRLTEGTAETFTAIATRMARGSRKGLVGAGVRARVALTFSAPGSALDAGPLAFALVSRRELARDWIASASTGPLPLRRLAARILERAAVLAARRAAEGDDYAPRVFATETVARAFERLLADREPLVWRHAAVARGVLAGLGSASWKTVVDQLHPRHSPTEWRRGAVSLVASIATRPDRALPKALDLIRGPIAARDRGLVATMVWGLPRALDAEPEAAESLLDAIVDADAAGAAEGIAGIMRDIGGDAGRRAVATARAVLADRLAQGIDDESEFLLARSLADELDPERAGDVTLRDAVARAVDLFVQEGARAAHAAALQALVTARVGMSTLEGLSGAAQNAMSVRMSVHLLRDLDLGLLEEPALANLLLLGGSREDAGAALEELRDRLGSWLLAHERHPVGKAASAIGISSRRLRALLHLLDDEGADREVETRATRAHERRVQAASLLFARLGMDGRSPLHRTLCATLARALDGLVREGVCEPVDVMLVSGARLDDPSDVGTLAEAAMDPDVESVLRAWARFIRVSTDEEPVQLLSERASGPPSGDEHDLARDLTRDLARTEERIAPSLAAKIEGLLELAAALGDDGSGRAEGLRAVLVRLARSLKQLSAIEGREGFERAGSAVDTLAGAAHAWAQIEAGARLRVLGSGDEDEPPASNVAVAAAGRLAAHLLRVGERDPIDARAAVHESLAELRRLLPPPVLRVVAEVLQAAAELPWQPLSGRLAQAVAIEHQLPAWLGARRTVGGFYVVRPLGGGAAASVFVARRIEERNVADAEQFALKVPDYDGAAARSLSEAEFMDFFRGEAAALLGLPPSPNLARFVTFDLGARPKPILVMELIEGPTLERFIATGEGASGVRAERAFGILDGVLAGLEVMHSHAIGHLDLKPSNVILRSGHTPTLVDFGLAGRVIRPGCATGPYGAPEVWGVLPDDFQGEPSPMAADVYAFGALAYEVLTGRTLFDADTEVAIISKHLVHDGHPPELARIAHIRPLVELIEHTLRRDPRDRWTVPQVRSALRAIAKIAGGFAWPLVA